MSERYNTAIFIGRFQPFHNGHLNVLKHGLQIADKVLVLVGSYKSPIDIKNPFTFDQRKKMILGSVSEQDASRIEVRGIRDFFYSDSQWLAEIQRNTPRDETGVAVLGNYKDSSSYYLKYFPQWDFIPTESDKLNATDIREWLFEFEQIPQHDVPTSTFNVLVEFSNSETYQNLKQEHAFIKRYKESWKDAPYPPTFLTADAVVVCSGHVLIVKRKVNPGKGKFALPGGFVKQDEHIIDAAVRELKEETKIGLTKLTLKSTIEGSKVFDYPYRSLRGRTVTEAFLFNLGNQQLPEILGSDDAEKAMWMPIAEAFENSENFFEDHLHIINAMMNKYA